VTSPTSSMLAATQHCTLLDDVFQEDPTTLSLESFIADLTGQEASLFVISGTMGNQLSVRTHMGGPPHSIIADAKSHVLEW
jgi:threonine aldolase